MWDSAAMRVAVIGLGLIGGSILRALADSFQPEANLNRGALIRMMYGEVES